MKKTRKGTDLTELTVPELQDKLQETRATLDKLRFSHAVSPIESPVQLRTRRKDLARVLTELRKRELANNSK